MPWARKVSIQSHSPSGFWLWKRESGMTGSLSASRKITLRCRLPRSLEEDVYS